MMSYALLPFLGGIGLFLFGMEVMTAALRELAGGGLRRWLARFTTTPLRGVLTGLAATAVIQSSTAVTVMTIGFVGAGVIGFSHALGVLFGANIGTTFTGWVVVLVGFKLKLGLVALPVMFGASMLALLGSGLWARVGRMLAGLSLLFIGLDMMQSSMEGLDGFITPDILPGDSFWGRIGLVLLGVVLVTLTQSSSAGVALTLVLLGSGAVTFTQAAAMVIGMNVGTTFTGLLAALGGSRAVRMTALANVLFNIGTAVLAFSLLSLIAPVLHLTPLGSDDQTALVLFHSLFNIVGTLVFLPFTSRFARLVERLVPERQVELAAPLDERLLKDEAAALDAAQMVCDQVLLRQARALTAAFSDPPDLRPMSALAAQVGPTLAALESYLAKIRIPPGHQATVERYGAVLHQVDHLSRLQDRLADQSALAVASGSVQLARPARALAALSEAVVTSGRDPAEVQAIADLVEGRSKAVRREVLSHEPGSGDITALFEKSDAARWLRRAADHLASVARHRAAGEAISAPAPR